MQYIQGQATADQTRTHQMNTGRLWIELALLCDAGDLGVTGFSENGLADPNDRLHGLGWASSDFGSS